MKKRFEEKIDKDGPNGCWLWTSAIRPNGYAVFWVGDGKSVYAHRLAYEWFRGPITSGLQVCHSCDVRRCVNPEHLFLGTGVVNIHDAVTKGRMGMKGEHNPAAKLSLDDIEMIRRLRSEGLSHEAIAVSFGVSRRTIGNVLTGRTYAARGVRGMVLADVPTEELQEELQRRGVALAA